MDVKELHFFDYKMLCKCFSSLIPAQQGVFVLVHLLMVAFTLLKIKDLNFRKAATVFRGMLVSDVDKSECEWVSKFEDRLQQSGNAQPSRKAFSLGHCKSLCVSLGKS